MATPVPVAGGFAAALETFMSRGGARVSKPRGKPGMRFSQGPIRGMTVEQATEKARGMWAAAPESVREKYAKREEGLMTGSERRKAMAAGIEPGSPTGGLREFSDGTRRAAPGDLNGDGTQDAVQPAVQAAADAAKPLNPASTTGAGRGTAIKDAPAGAPGATGTPGAAGPTGAPDWETMGVASREKPPQTQATGEPGPWREPTDAGKPKVAAALEGVQVGTGANAGKINPLTGRPIGYVPPTQAIPGIERPSAGMSFDPKYGAVPKATEVPEAPMSATEYGRVKASQDVNDVNALDPTSPEASAARGRMRSFEESENAKAAAVARRERLGPSAAEIDAQQRKARRKLDASVARSYGNTRQF